MGEEAGAGDHVPVVVCKGKRSKRLRVHAATRSPAAMMPAAYAESSSSVADDGWPSPGADQAEEEEASGCVTEEEEDMALCLMLLARGGTGRAGRSSSPVVVPADSTAKEGKFRSRRAAGTDGEFVYECRTCGKCFPSFQALGGHRTSHKKPRLLLPPTPPLSPPTTDEKKRLSTTSPAAHATADPTMLAIPVPATPPKHEAVTATVVTSGRSGQQQGSRLHECSTCGAEFASGQALGGHMRRHRPLVPASPTDDVGAVAVIGVKERSLLELDLNMPAPCDDSPAETTASFPFAVEERSAAKAILFPAPASTLLDCHY